MGCGNQPDECSCVQALGQSAADAVYATHRDTWITQEDILEIANFGFDTVRIPVDFWMKEDIVQPNESSPRGALPYLDRLVGWCADAGLYVTMDVHAGPGGAGSESAIHRPCRRYARLFHSIQLREDAAVSGVDDTAHPH